MATATTRRSFAQFTPLLESNGGRLQSKATANGRRVYKDVTIIKAGMGNQRDKNYYPLSVLEANLERFDGLRAYADHPDSLSEEVQPERTVRDMVGVYTNPRVVREGREQGRVVANLHLFRSSKWLSDVVDDLIELGQADKIGLSINGRGRTVEKALTFEEAAEPVTVNWVEEFLQLRSADVVTEAGAGGGFPQLLESARGSVHKGEKEMKRLTTEQKTAIKAAVDANDTDKLSVLMKECGCTDTDTAKTGKVKEAKPAKGKRVETAVEAEDDGDETAEASGDEDDAALDTEADRIKEDAETLAADEDDDDLEEAGEDDADEDEDAVREARGSGMPKGAGKLISGKSGGRHGGMIKGPKETKGAFVKPGSQTPPQGGRRYAESDYRQLDRKVNQLMEENARLSAQLRIRTTTDRARNLLRESAIPEKMRPAVLRLLVGKSEDDMRGVIRYHEQMIQTAIEESVGYVEGAGARFRESTFSDAGGATHAMSAALDGLPLKG